MSFELRADGSGSKRTAVRSRMLTLWKALSIVLIVILVASLAISISMYDWPDMPSSPKPSEGRIYPLNNHGHYTYMNESEYRLRQIIWSAWLPLLLLLVTIQHFIDPFGERRRRELYGSPPRNFR